MHHQASGIFQYYTAVAMCVFFSFKFCPFSCSFTENRCRRWQLHRPKTETYSDVNSMENIIFSIYCIVTLSYISVCIWTTMLDSGKAIIVKSTEIWCSIKHEIALNQMNSFSDKARNKLTRWIESEYIELVSTLYPKIRPNNKTK